MKNIYRFPFLITCILLSFQSVFAQQGGEVEMADVLRSNGKIYVVVAVLLIILAGLFIFLINIDRKVSRLEKKNKDQA